MPHKPDSLIKRQKMRESRATLFLLITKSARGIVTTLRTNILPSDTRGHRWSIHTDSSKHSSKGKRMRYTTVTQMIQRHRLISCTLRVFKSKTQTSTPGFLTMEELVALETQCQTPRWWPPRIWSLTRSSRTASTCHVACSKAMEWAHLVLLAETVRWKVVSSEWVRAEPKQIPGLGEKKSIRAKFWSKTAELIFI